MAVLGWVMGLGTLWIVCAWVVAVLLGGVILRSGTVRTAPSVPLPPGAPSSGPASVPAPPRAAAAAVAAAAGTVAAIVPQPRSAVPRRDPRAACVRPGRPAPRD